MAAATVSRRARWFVTAGTTFLVLWQLAVLLDAGRRTTVALGLYGFVLHVVFGKALSLVPSYFERDLAFPIAPAVQLPLTVLGALALAVDPLAGAPEWTGAVGSLAWLAGAVVFVATMAWTLRGNFTGRETGTGEANADRRRVDRFANAFVPVVMGYLLLGAYETAASHAGLPAVFGGYPPGATHLLAAGTASLLVLAIGFRLLPRFLVARPPEPLVWLVLPAGALGPILLAESVPAGSLLPVGAALEAVAIGGFGLAFVVLFARSERRRVGFYGVLLGAIAGVLGVGLGVQFALGSFDPALVSAHLRLNLLGFLGLTIVGVAYQFYPPGAGTFRGASDRTAAATIACLAGGLGLQVGGLAGDVILLERLGAVLSLLGSLGFAYLVLGLFRERFWS